MSNGRLSPWIVQQMVNQVDVLSKWMGLCFADPSAVSDPLTVEIASFGYQREGSTWLRTGYNMVTLDNDITIHGLAPGDVVAAVVGWDSQYNGRMIFCDLLTPPKTYPSGGVYTIPAGEFVVGLDLAGTLPST